MSKLLKLKTIDQATTNDGVDQTRDLGNNSISVISIPDIVKKRRRKAIDDAEQIRNKKLINTNYTRRKRRKEKLR